MITIVICITSELVKNYLMNCEKIKFEIFQSNWVWICENKYKIILKPLKL